MFAAATAAAAVLVACGGRSGPAEQPVPSLAGSLEAQNAFRPILKRWSRSSSAERVRMEAEIARLRAQHPTDPLARLADTFLAWIALERGDLERAESLAKQVQAASAGNTSNLALVVEGAALSRRGRHVEGLAKLRPLVNKLIDPYARALLDEELVVAALGARRWDEAVAFMGLWRREADDPRAVRARIEALALELPPDEVVRILARRDLAGDQEIHALLARRLATVAAEKKDVALAKQLLATSGSLLGEQGNAVAQLAAGAGAARFEAPTVGILLSLREDETRRRGVEAAAGAAHALGIPGSGARLVSRDDAGALENIDTALEALGADGAGVVIAGVDQAEAAAVARFAAARELPVLLLRPPATPVRSRFVFVIGEDPAAVRDVLVAGLAAKGADAIGMVGEGPSPARPEGTVADATKTPGLAAFVGCDQPFPAAAWKKLGITGLVLGGSPACATAAVIASNASDFNVKIALGLDLGTARHAGSVLLASAGIYPMDASATDRPQVKDWMSARRAPPSWWAGLGHDAALLAWEGVKGLPDTPTDDPAQVRRRRAAAADAVTRASVDLWTTTARGLEGGQVLPRAIRAIRPQDAR